MGEKFSVAEVAALRNELLQGGLDSFQTADTAFRRKMHSTQQAESNALTATWNRCTKNLRVWH
jgi:hypothetical protein